MAVTKEILQSHPVKNLKAELRKVKKTLNYGKLKKDELIKLMLKPENINFFKHIKMFMPPPRKPKTNKEEPKKETKKEEPKKKEAKKETKKEETKKEETKKKPNFMILKEKLEELLKQLKKSYEKNKPKLDKMTPTKYKNTIKRQNSKYLDDAKDIYNSLRYNFDINAVKKVDKEFYKIIPEEKPKTKKEETKKKETKKEEPKKDEKDNIPYEKTLYKTLFQYSRGDPVDFQCYKGMSFYLFLEVMQRNKNDCVLGSAKELFENFNFTKSRYGIGLRDFKNKSQQLLNKYEECAKRNKILVYPIFQPGHANMLVFNYKLNQIEYYEPHGKGSKIYEDAIKKLVEYFKKNGKTKFSKNIQYSPSIKSCPIIPKSSLKIFKENDIQIREDYGLQIYDGTKEQEKQKIKNSIGNFYSDTKGFCCMWSFLYMDFRLKNPTSPTNQLGNDLMKMIKGNPKKFFREYIRGYTFDIMKRLNTLIGDQFLYAVNHPKEKFYQENTKKINDKFKSVIMKMWNDAGGQ